MVGPHDINVQRMRDFEHSAHGNLRLLPPSRSGLVEHAKRAAYEAGWTWFQCLENVDMPSPLEWGWREDNSGTFLPKWQDMEIPIEAEFVVSTCSCVKAKCSNCNCKKGTTGLPVLLQM